MSEQLRSILVTVEVDTNRRTIEVRRLVENRDDAVAAIDEALDQLD